MTARAVELALKKHELQLQSSALRDDLASYGRGVEPVFAVADATHATWLWFRRRPAIPVAIGVALVVARPRVVMRWGRRAWLAWQAVQRWRQLLADQRQSPRR